MRDTGMGSAEAAFTAFVTARTAALSRTAYLLTGDHHLAEDLVQTALFKTAKAWDRIEGDPEPYVRRILYTENISWWRRRRHVVETALPAHDSGFDAYPGGSYGGTFRGGRPQPDADLRMALETALAQLTAKQRTVLVLRFFEDLTEVQAAATLGISVGTVKSTTRQALTRLRTVAPHLGALLEVTR